MTAPSNAPADVVRDYLRLVQDGRTDQAGQLLAGLADARAIAFVGAEFTARARRIGRTLPTAMRAQSSTRHVLLGQLRDANRGDVEGLRSWLRAAAEELQYVQRLAEVAHRRLGSGG